MNPYQSPKANDDDPALFDGILFRFQLMLLIVFLIIGVIFTFPAIIVTYTIEQLLKYKYGKQPDEKIATIHTAAVLLQCGLMYYVMTLYYQF